MPKQTQSTPIYCERNNRYCKMHEAEIFDKAERVYKIGCNKNHYLNYTCCDFKKLETVYLNYGKEVLTSMP